LGFQRQSRLNDQVLSRSTHDPLIQNAGPIESMSSILSTG
jgi:hypothetical protein